MYLDADTKTRNDLANGPFNGFEQKKLDRMNTVQLYQESFDKTLNESSQE